MPKPVQVISSNRMNRTYRSSVSQSKFNENILEKGKTKPFVYRNRRRSSQG